MTQNRTSQAVNNLANWQEQEVLNYENIQELAAIVQKYQRMELALNEVVDGHGRECNCGFCATAAREAIAFDPLSDA